jgi:cation diffusion facilitator family transporter
MFANILLAAGKMVAGILGHSYALVADAVESIADVFSSMVVWRAMIVAEEPADAEHPYGHGKAEPIAAGIVSTMLLLASGGIAFTAITALRIPREQPPQLFTLIVLVAVILVKEILFRVVVREAGAIDSAAMRADAWHHRSDAITSLAAGIGITVALVGGKGYESADAIAALAAACIIAYNGWQLLASSLNELMDIAPKPEVVQAIRDVALSVVGVSGIEKCIVRKSGHLFWVEMHVEVDPQMTVIAAHDIAHSVKDKIRESNASVGDVLIHVEPAGQKTLRN